MPNFHGLYVGNNRMMVLPQYGGKLFTYADDLSLTPALLIDGFFELGLTRFVMQNVHAGMTVLDIGANLGYFSVLFGIRVGQEGTVLAFEPNPEIHALLVDNLTVNEQKHNVIVSRKAVNDTGVGVLEFNMSRRFKGNSSIMPHSDQYKADFKSDDYALIHVECINVDSLDLDYVDLVKIDVEGAEYRALKGMEQMLAEGKVKQVVFELNKSMLQGDTQLLYDFLLAQQTNNGAMFYLLNPQGNPVTTTLDYIFRRDYIDNILMKF